MRSISGIRVLALAAVLGLAGPTLADVLHESALIAPDALEPGDEFGTSVGLGAEHLFGGAPGTSSGTGVVRLFERAEEVWQVTRDWGVSGLSFGFSLALSMDDDGDPWIAAGQERYNTLFGWIPSRMTTYEFAGDASAPSRSASGSSSRDDFASAVAISAGGSVRTALAGAPRRSTTTDEVTSVSLVFDGFGYANADIGAIVTFSGGGGEGAHAEIFSVRDGGIRSIRIIDGGSGYTSDPSVVIPQAIGGGNSATGRASRYGEVGGITFLDLDGAGTQSLTPSSFGASSRFGYAVAIHGDVAAASTSSGLVSLLVRDPESGTWSLSQTLTTPEGAHGFGTALALSDDLLLVGAPASDGLDDTDVGSAFLYALDDLSEPLLELGAETPIAREQLGHAVTIGEDFIALSAPGSNPLYGVHGTVTGRVLTFSRETGEELDEFSANEGSLDDYFGVKIGVSGRNLAVGAPRHDEERGAIFLFEIPELDQDEDGVADAADNCPATPNAGQEDLDDDNVGDDCDPDRDGDGVANESDSFPDDSTETADTDVDGVGDNTDNCLVTPNPGQENTDSDGFGDVCDNCSATPNPGQEDLDDDSVGDDCDPDRDGDGVANESDSFPDDSTETADTDADGVGDNTDNCPATPNPGQEDLDDDSVGDDCDPDRDGDSFSDIEEIAAGSDPLDADSIPAPEPASVVLQLTALLTLMAMRRQRIR